MCAGFPAQLVFKQIEFRMNIQSGNDAIFYASYMVTYIASARMVV
jgi:hypothetical protein